MFSPEDVYLAIEKDQLVGKLKSAYQATDEWTKVLEDADRNMMLESLKFKALMDFLASGDISYNDVFDRLKILADKEFDKQYENPNDTPIYVYLTALAELNVPFTEATQERYHKGCEIVGQVENLHWARRHVWAWANYP